MRTHFEVKITKYKSNQEYTLKSVKFSRRTLGKAKEAGQKLQRGWIWLKKLVAIQVARKARKWKLFLKKLQFERFEGMKFVLIENIRSEAFYKRVCVIDRLHFDPVDRFRFESDKNSCWLAHFTIQNFITNKFSFRIIKSTNRRLQIDVLLKFSNESDKRLLIRLSSDRF